MGVSKASTKAKSKSIYTALTRARNNAIVIASGVTTNPENMRTVLGTTQAQPKVETKEDVKPTETPIAPQQTTQADIFGNAVHNRAFAVNEQETGNPDLECTK